MAFLGLLKCSVTLLPWLGCKSATWMYSISLCLRISLSQSPSFSPARFHSVCRPHSHTSAAESFAEGSIYPARLSLDPLRLSCHASRTISRLPQPGHPGGWSPALPAVLAQLLLPSPQQTQPVSGIHNCELRPLQTAWGPENFSTGLHLAGLPSCTEFGRASAQLHRRCEQGSDFRMASSSSKIVHRLKRESRFSGGFVV